MDCNNENYRFNELCSPVGSYRCQNDCMCDGKRKCNLWDTKTPGICTGNPKTGKFAGCAPFYTPPEGHMYNLVSPLAMYIPPRLTNEQKANLKCVWNKF